MRRTMTTFATRPIVAALCLVTTALPAQGSRSREADRRAERLAQVIERAVDQGLDEAMRAVDGALDGLDWRSRDGGQGVSRVDTTFAFAKDGTVDLTSVNGSITVTGWTRNEARVRAGTERGGLRVRFSQNRITIENDGYRGRGESTYELSVPQGVRVMARSMSGDITVRGTKGAVEAHTTNGEVDVTDATERIDIGTLSGEVRGSQLNGEVEASSLNGTVDLRDVRGRRVHAESTSGDIELVNVSSRDIDVSTVSGDVGFSGPIDAGGTYSFASHSGEVTLRVPANVSARFSIETFNGELDSDFPVTLQPNRDRQSGRRLEFNVGGGEARVTVESFSGGINIRRQQRQ